MSIIAKLSRIEKHISLNNDFRANQFYNEDGSLRIFWIYKITAEYFDHVLRNQFEIMQHCCREIEPEIKDKVFQSDFERAIPEDLKEQIRK